MWNCFCYSLRLERCSLSPSIVSDNINSYIVMHNLNIFLCSGALLFAVFVNSSHPYHPLHYLNNSSGLFRWRIYLFIVFVISIICNQLASAFVCRSIDILYDIRFTSMIIVQIIGLLICLLFAFLLGIKYASLNYVS
jgi:predicted permease